MTFMCYLCAFQTKDRADFLDNQGDGRHYWLVMICPQCSVTNPPVAEATYGVSPYKLSNVVLEETNHGVYVTVVKANGGSDSNPIHAKHLLLNHTYKGMTLRDYDAMLKARGTERSSNFRKEVSVLLAQKAAGEITLDVYAAEMDTARAKNFVGDYDTKVKFHLAPLQQTAP